MRELPVRTTERHWHGPPPTTPVELVNAWIQDSYRSRVSLTYRFDYRDPQIVSLTRRKVGELLLGVLRTRRGEPLRKVLEESPEWAALWEAAYG